MMYLFTFCLSILYVAVLVFSAVVLYFLSVFCLSCFCLSSFLSAAFPVYCLFCLSWLSVAFPVLLSKVFLGVYLLNNSVFHLWYRHWHLYKDNAIGENSTGSPLLANLTVQKSFQVLFTQQFTSFWGSPGRWWSKQALPLYDFKRHVTLTVTNQVTRDSVSYFWPT